MQKGLCTTYGNGFWVMETVLVGGRVSDKGEMYLEIWYDVRFTLNRYWWITRSYYLIEDSSSYVVNVVVFESQRRWNERDPDFRFIDVDLQGYCVKLDLIQSRVISSATYIFTYPQNFILSNPSIYATFLTSPSSTS